MEPPNPPTPTDKASPSFARRVALICLGAGGLRLIYVLAVTRGAALAGDALYYSAQGLAIAEGRGFAHPFYFAQTMPAADHPPLTALVDAIGPLLVGSSHEAFGLPLYVFVQRLTMVLVGTITVGLIGLVGRRTVDERVGLVAAGLAAVHPALWINDGLLMSESIAALSIAGVLWCAVRAWDSPRWSTWMGLGASVGLAALVRSESIALLVLLVLPMVLMSRRRDFPVAAERPALSVLRRVAVDAGAAGTACVLVVSTWLVPNALRFEERTLFSTNDGLTWLGANCPETYAGPNAGLWSLRCLATVDTDGNGRDDFADLEAWSPFQRVDEDQSQVSRRYQEAAFDFVSDRRADVPRVATIRVLRTWGVWGPAQMVERDQGEGRTPWVSWLALVASFVLLPFAAIGTRDFRRRERPIWPFVSQALLVTVVAALVLGSYRFRLGWDVAACVLGAAGLVAVVRPRR